MEAVFTLGIGKLNEERINSDNLLWVLFFGLLVS